MRKMKRANVISSDEPHAVQVIQAECADQQIPYDGTKAVHTVHENGDAVEEVFVYEDSVLWTAGKSIRKRFNLPSGSAKCLQVCLTTFLDYGDKNVMCLLHKKSMTTCTADGQLLDVPLDQPISEIWPIPSGLLLSGVQQSSTWLLTHPLQELLPVLADFAIDSHQSSYAGWMGQTMIWSSNKLPFVATFSESSHRVSVWRIDSTPPDAVANLGHMYDLPAVTPGTGGMMSAWTPAPSSVGHHLATLLGNTPAAPNTGASRGTTTRWSAGSTKKPSLRTLDGKLSPGIFNPHPHQSVTYTAPMLPNAIPSPPAFIFKLVLHHQLPEGAVPSEAHLVTNAQGRPVLCVACKEIQHMFAFNLPTEDSDAGLAFELPAKAIAAMSCTKGTSSSAAMQRTLKELLVLKPSGQLAIYQGHRLLCEVSFSPAATLPAPPVQAVPTTELIEQPSTVPSPCQPSPGDPGSDMEECSSDEDMQMSPCVTPYASTAGKSFMSSLPEQEALVPSEVVGLSANGTNRVRLHLSTGKSLTAQLSLKASDPLPSAVLKALQCTLDEDTYHTLLVNYILQPDGCCGHLERDWKALRTVLLTWVTDPLSLQLTQNTTDAAANEELQGARYSTPKQAQTAADSKGIGTASSAQGGAGSETASGSSAWESLLSSELHRKIVEGGKYAWLQDLPSKPQSKVSSKPGPSKLTVSVLQALHWVYEDFKLHVLHWPFLKMLGTMLAQLACHLQAWRYWEHYARDLGPEVLEEAGVGCPPVDGARDGGDSTASSIQPLDLFAALAGLIQGKSSTSVPACTPGLEPCVGRSLKVLAIYRLICQHSSNCTAAVMQLHSARLLGTPTSTAAAEAARAVRQGADALVELMVQQGWRVADMETLPLGVALPMREAFQKCRTAPPTGWPHEAYALIGREDIVAIRMSNAATAATSQHPQVTPPPRQPSPLSPPAKSSPATASPMLITPGLTYGGARKGVSSPAAAPGSGGPTPAAPPTAGTSFGLSTPATPQSVYPLPLSLTPISRASPMSVSQTPMSPTLGSYMQGATSLMTPSNIGSGSGTPTASSNAMMATPIRVISPCPSSGSHGQNNFASPTSPSLCAANPGAPQANTSPITSFPAPAIPAALHPTMDDTPVHPSTPFTPAPRRPTPPPFMPPLPHSKPESRTAEGAPRSSWYQMLLPHTQRLLPPAATSVADVGSSSSSPAAQGTGKKGGKKGTDLDGMEGMVDDVVRLRFGRDNRLSQVQHLLRSSAPVPLKLDLPEGDPDLLSKQQLNLMCLALRTIALPIGRGAFTLATHQPLPTEPVSIPALCLAGLLPEQSHAAVNLDMSQAPPAPGGGAAADFTAWPEFHNGVAAGLRLLPAHGSSDRSQAHLAHTWLVYNKPESPTYAHAGLLMALGLTGYLNQLAFTDVFRYLSDQHDATTIGILLGMAAAKRGSMDSTASRAMFLHLPARHPHSFPEIELSPLVQAVALLGVGILHEGSCHRLMAEIMLEEIGRHPSGNASHSGDHSSSGHHGGAVTQDREGYALAAGLALGLITLGKGSNAVNLCDLKFVEHLERLMCGTAGGGSTEVRTAQPSSLNALESVFGVGYMDPSLGHNAIQRTIITSSRNPELDASHHHSHAEQLVLEGNLVNLNVTSPAATVALALMYLKTNDAAVAAKFVIPDTHFALDFVRPDFVLLRMLGRSLVMWDYIDPSVQWVESQLPPLIKTPLPKLQDLLASHGSCSGDRDLQAIAQAHINAVAGACFALGLRFAGSASAQAEGVMRHFVQYLLAAKVRSMNVAATAKAKLDPQALEACLDVVVLSLSVIMAGTGHLPTLRLLHHLSRRLQSSSQGVVLSAASGVNYGNHMAISMAIGFLFLGGGARTFSTSNAAIAMLLASLFPKFPHTPTDQRSHLQAFRHLYVLATQPRCVKGIDVDSKQNVYVPITITAKRTAFGGTAPNTSKTDAAIQPAQEEEPVLKLSTRQNMPPSLMWAPLMQRLPGGRSAGGARGGGRGGMLDGIHLEGGANASMEGVFTFDRVVPCLLPEQQHVQRVEVRGPRYWPQTLEAGPPGLSGLDQLYSQRVVVVKKKAGSLPYADDPSGIRSLLSRAFQRSNTANAHTPTTALSSSQSTSLDLVHLCATFAVDPFIMAFSQHVSAMASHGSGQSRLDSNNTVDDELAVESSGKLHCEHEAFLSFCHSTLYECITGEKTTVLPSYLQLYCLVQALTGPKSRKRKDEDVAGLRAECAVASLTCGAGPTIGLWSLRLAREYYSSAQAQAGEILAGMIHDLGEAEGNADLRSLWDPLLQPMFLDSLWKQLQGLWQDLNFLPIPHPSTTSSSPTWLHQYLQSGRMPTTPIKGGSQSPHTPAWVRQLFGTCLALCSIPMADDVRTATAAARSMAAALQPPHATPGAPIGRQALMMACLATQLPQVQPSTLLLLSGCMDGDL